MKKEGEGKREKGEGGKEAENLPKTEKIKMEEG